MFLFHFHFWKIVLLGKKFIFSCCCQDFIFQHFYYDVSGYEFLCYYPNWNLLSKFHEYGTTFHGYVVYSFSSVGNFSTIIPSNVISVSFSSPHSISITYMFMCLKVSHIFLRLCSIFYNFSFFTVLQIGYFLLIYLQGHRFSSAVLNRVVKFLF